MPGQSQLHLPRALNQLGKCILYYQAQYDLRRHTNQRLRIQTGRTVGLLL